MSGDPHTSKNITNVGCCREIRSTQCVHKKKPPLSSNTTKEAFNLTYDMIETIIKIAIHKYKV